MMRLLNAIPLVRDAQKRGYAVPAFNNNGGTYDIARAMLEAAQELNAPLIMQCYEPNLEYRGFRYSVELLRSLMAELHITVPVAMHLDHGHSFASAVQAMHAGYTSVMLDASHEPLDANIAETKAVLRVARSIGVSVEAEVGYVKGNEPKKEKPVGMAPLPKKPSTPGAKTSLEEAERFVRETEVDMLAVAIGSIHGCYESQTDLDFDLLSKLRSRLSVPLVAHGTCGISLEDLSRLAQTGMSKINFGEGFRMSYIRYFREYSEELEHMWHPWRIMREVKNRLKADMKELICALGAEGKADGVETRMTKQQ
jgi:fructose-bisphosphate aldolase, class II